MPLSSSPYAVFRAADWSSLVADPIGIGQCLRIKQKKHLQRFCGKGGALNAYGTTIRNYLFSMGEVQVLLLDL